MFTTTNSWLLGLSVLTVLIVLGFAAISTAPQPSDFVQTQSVQPVNPAEVFLVPPTGDTEASIVLPPTPTLRPELIISGDSDGSDPNAGGGSPKVGGGAPN